MQTSPESLRAMTLKGTGIHFHGERACARCSGLGYHFDAPGGRGDRGGLIVCRCLCAGCRCEGKAPYEFYDPASNSVRPCVDAPVRRAIERIRLIERASGIPERFQGRYLESIDPGRGQPGEAFTAMGRVLRLIQDFPLPVEDGDRRGLYIHGETGTGKTLLACVILNELIRLHQPRVRYAKISRDVLGKLRATFNPNSPLYGEARRIEEDFGSVPVLVIDDFGVHRETEWVNTVLYDLIDARYENNLTTILTSNEPIESWKNLFGGRIYSRLCGMVLPVHVSGVDRRVSA